MNGKQKEKQISSGLIKGLYGKHKLVYLAGRLFKESNISNVGFIKTE